jgi:hypothetical protein
MEGGMYGSGSRIVDALKVEGASEGISDSGC